MVTADALAKDGEFLARRNRAKQGIIRVGDGRGFVVENGKLVITAAHCLCLSDTSPTDLALFPAERICQNLLAPLGEEPIISAEMLFVEPISDLAILGAPDVDGQAPDHAKTAYHELMANTLPLSVADVSRATTVGAWLLSLDDRWFHCRAREDSGPLWLSDAAEDIVGGMSGSPIIADDGSAIGVLCNAGGCNGAATGARAGGPNARLAYHLPLWLSSFFPTVHLV